MRTHLHPPGTQDGAVVPGAPAYRVTHPALGCEHPLCAGSVLVLESSHDHVLRDVPVQGGRTSSTKGRWWPSHKGTEQDVGMRHWAGKEKESLTEQVQGRQGCEAGRGLEESSKWAKQQVQKQPGWVDQRQVVGGDGV